jgi:histidinol-phosphate transaminase
VAPEHLELAVRDVDGLLADIRHAGAIFMGRWGCEALGDYCAGPSHVLPTMRTPRFSSPLGVYDFQKRSSLIEPSAAGADHLAKVAATLARAEGLEAHAQSAEYRLGGDGGNATAAGQVASDGGVAPAAAGTVSAAQIAARVERHVRPDVQRMAAYHVADATDAIKLDAMENPWRLPGALQAELAQRLAALAINRYPSGNTYTALKQAIARHDGLDGIDGLVLGNGSDELISLLCQLVAQPGATIMAPAPSFVMYEMGARLAGVGFVPVPLRPDFSLDREAMLQAIETHRPALVFLAYPNNPTGNLFDADDVRAILQATDGLVVLDEAYAPFAGGASWLSQLTAWPNLAVMRTCSKWGLAGARIGYLASAPAWAAQLDKIRPPYNISALDAETACFAFQHHADFDHQTQALCTERQTLVQRLQALRGPQGLSHVYPTAANFVLVRLAGGQDDASGPSRATRVAAAMRAAGVLIKDASRMHPALAECLRLTVGAPEENEAMLQALAAALDAVPAASAGLADGASQAADANGRAHGERTSS